MSQIVSIAVGNPPLTFHLTYKGIIEGLSRPGKYESYPCAMWDSDRAKLWFAGDPADNIYFGESLSTLGPFGVHHGENGEFGPVIAPSSRGPDSWLVADPSVVKVPVARSDWRYYMYYTGIMHGGVNHIFGATSRDGVNWIKFDPRSTGSAQPLISPDPQDSYGAGQSSTIWMSEALGELPNGYNFVHFYSEITSVFQGVRLAVSRDGVTFDRKIPLIRQPGETSWDFKWHHSNRMIGFLAHQGDSPDPRTGHREGRIGITVSNPGTLTSFSPVQFVPMRRLTNDSERWSINNGGLLGNPQGLITENESIFYFGSGFALQEDPQPDGRYPPNYWDIGAVSINIDG